MSLKKLGRYEVLRVLGKGAMGIVYEGRDPNLDRRVAIKTVRVENLSPEAAADYEARFRTEARSAARLQHPNIVSVYDSDRDGDVAYLVMEYIQGDDLKHHMDQGVRFTLEQAFKMMRDLLSALDYAHQQGIIHRDIKPANLLLEPGGRLKLADFGVARMQDAGDATRTQGMAIGTLKYMAPEQVQGQKIDARADLFSAGVVLYQLLTDRRPFDADNDFSIIQQIIGHAPPAPSGIHAGLPAALDAVVARALAKDRNERFASAREFSSALQSAMRRAQGLTVVPPPDPSRQSGPSGNGAHTQVGAEVEAITAQATRSLESSCWEKVRESNDPLALSGYLQRFPTGVYAELARRRLDRLEAGACADQTVLAGVMAPPPPATGPAQAPVSAPAPLLARRRIAPAWVTAATAAVVVGLGLAVTVPQGPDAVSAPMAPSVSAPAVTGVTPVVASLSNTPPVSGSQALTVSKPVVLPAQASLAVQSQAGSVPLASGATAPTAPPAPRKAASAARAKYKPAPAASDTTLSAAPTPAKVRAETSAPEPAAQRIARISAPLETCKDRTFLSREYCLHTECAKPAFQNAPICVRRRDEARLREESRLHN